MRDLDGCGSFVILGATGAVGRRLAADLHARGAELVLVGRDRDRLSEVAGPLAAATHVLGDCEATSVRDLLLGIAAERPLRGIAHCIGSLLLKPARSTTTEEWHEVLTTNLSSAFGVAMAAGQVLPAGGAIVFCSSVAATLGLANHEAIAAAKAGLIGLARAIAASHARRGIRCHCVAPALVESDMTAALLARPGMRDTCSAQNPSGRIGDPGDVARAIAFLLDPANAWLDGQVLGVDGGYGVLRSPGT